MTIDANDLRTIRNRYQAHLESGDHLLRPGQLKLGNDVADYMGTRLPSGEFPNAGYFVRPTGTGKTVSFIDFFIGANTLPGGTSVIGDEVRQKRTLVMVPWNFLLNQWEDELLGKLKQDGTRASSKFKDRILPEHVGVYRSTDSFEKKKEALSKPMVLITYDAARMLGDEVIRPDANKISETAEQRHELAKMLKAENFPIVELDEVHDRPHGAETSKFLKDHYFNKSFVLAGTATHLFKSGHTVGDDLFGGQIPIHETTFVEAINAKEIAPMRNIIAEVQLDEAQRAELHDISQEALKRARRKGATAEQCDYSERELERISEISQRDEAAIRLLQRGRDPLNGKKYSEMKQVWYCASVKHAQHVADKLNEVMGKDYAVAVHGTMDGEEQDKVLINYKVGEHRALTNCQLLVHGFDDAEAELCMQLVPSRSPNRVMQQGGRVMRLNPNDKNKIANVVTFVYPGIEQQIFGELAGGFIMIPKDQQEAISQSVSSSGTGEELRAWPPIEGLKVHYTTDELTLFAEERSKARYAKGLPVKDESMRTVEEMARLLFPTLKDEKLAIEIRRLQERVYEPLQEAFQNRGARQKFVGLDDGVGGKDMMAVRGQRFPVSEMGLFNDKGKARFCVNEHAAVLCRYAVFGSMNEVSKGWIPENKVASLGKLDGAKVQEVLDKIKAAYIDRKGYERVITLDLGERKTVNVSLDDIGYFKRGNAVGFYVKPDALIPIYQLVTGKDQSEAKGWLATHPMLKQMKTHEWMNKEDVVQRLGIATTSEQYPQLDKWWGEFESAFKRAGNTVAGKPKDVPAPGDRKNTLVAAKMLSIGEHHPETCLHRKELEYIKEMLGIESDVLREKAARARA